MVRPSMESRSPFPQHTSPCLSSRAPIHVRPTSRSKSSRPRRTSTRLLDLELSLLDPTDPPLLLHLPSLSLNHASRHFCVNALLAVLLVASPVQSPCRLCEGLTSSFSAGRTAGSSRPLLAPPPPICNRLSRHPALLPGRLSASTLHHATPHLSSSPLRHRLMDLPDPYAHSPPLRQLSLSRSSLALLLPPAWS